MTSWSQIIKAETEKKYYKAITSKVKIDAKTHQVFPPHEEIFNAFKLCSFDNTKVLILGQDPYHGKGQAHGLSFSVKSGMDVPPSLKNIFKEIKNDIGIENSANGDLTSWAKQGILLLNSSLTVLEGLAGSHSKIGWHTFTDTIISILNEREVPTVFILWGAHARSKRTLLTNSIHLVLEGTHPSPLGANQGGFFGEKFFSKTNNFLTENNLEPINWKT